MIKKISFVFGLFVLMATATIAQVGQGTLKGKVTDASTGEPLPFVNIVVELNGNQVTGGSSDFDGNYTIKPITPGKYDVKASFTGFKPVQLSGVVIRAEKTDFADLKLSPSIVDIEEFEIVEYTVPLISKDNTSSGGTVTKEDILRMPGRSAASIAETVGGVQSQDNGSGGLNIRGARSGDNWYFVDGMKVRGSNAVPQQSIEQVTVVTGGVPAQYGDVTGGVISITTKGPSKQFFGGAEYVTSGYQMGDRVVGLDRFGYNLLELSLSGPILFKKDAEGNKTDEPLLGFFISGNGLANVDPRSSIIGNWKLKDDRLEDIRNNPLRFAETGAGTFQNAEFLRLDDFEKVRTRPNVAARNANFAGKIDVNTGKTTNLTFGGTFTFDQRNQSNFARGGGLNSLFGYSAMNWENNPQRTEYIWRVYGRFTQRFSRGSNMEDEESASIIKNAYYSIQAEYSRQVVRNWDEFHRDNYFAYGYYGRYQREIARDYDFGLDTVLNVFGYRQTTFVDTLIKFYPNTEINPEAAQFTTDYYNLFGWDVRDNTDPNAPAVYDREVAGDALRNFVEIQSRGGLINGDIPRDIYGMWRGHAYQYNNVSNFENSSFRVTASGSADIKGHAISLGFEYEEWADRSFSLSPIRLWEFGRLYANDHIRELDFANPIETGEFFQSVPVINYERFNSAPGAFSGSDPQRFFDYNLRNSLGLDPDGVDFIDFDDLTPDQLSLDFFSADELLANGLGLVSYYGFDHHGNRLNRNPSFDDFFTEQDEFGNFTRPIGAFRPIYISGYIQDNFSIDDLVFRVGLRVDRFDANQQTLVDPFVLHPTVRAGEEEALALADGAHPGNIGDNFVVYVDNLQDPTSIVGYRDGRTWYNAQGSEISNPSILRTVDGVAPLLVDKENVTSQDINSSSFTDYTPQVNFMPRIAFSFPISDEALFFAHYDVLTQRPSTGRLRLNPSDYFFLESNNNFLNNPNLRPSQTIDYALGFQQKLTNSSSLKIESFYREMRDQVQVVNVSEAFPRQYRTFDNLDFGTVKGVTLTYDLRRTGNIWMRASYTLQFAEGTGSNETTAQSLIIANRDNLLTTNPFDYDQRHVIVTTFDYRYGKGKDYNGPVINGKQILARTGANFVLNTASGVPFTSQKNIIQDALFQSARGITDGSINGSRLPWQFRVDARFDRDIDVTVGPGEKPLVLNVYLQVLNMFNNANITQVYRSTGNVNDDGFLAAPEWQNDIVTSVNEQSFREFYLMKLNNPGFFNLPRRIRLGMLVTF